MGEHLPRTASMLAWLREGALRDQHDAAALPVVESLLETLAADLEAEARAAEGCDLTPPAQGLDAVADWLRAVRGGA